DRGGGAGQGAALVARPFQCREAAGSDQSRDREEPAQSGIHPVRRDGDLSRGGPPGWTERVRAASALVLAPHFDDEVLGCGGLLAQLAASGAAVRVLFLTDGSGGVEAVADRDAYRRRRCEEATRAVAALGADKVAALDILEIPAGALDQPLAAA